MNTNVQLREELFREINPLLDNDTAIRKVLVYLRSVKPSAVDTTSAEAGKNQIGRFGYSCQVAS